MSKHSNKSTEERLLNLANNELSSLSEVVKKTTPEEMFPEGKNSETLVKEAFLEALKRIGISTVRGVNNVNTGNKVI